MRSLISLTHEVTVHWPLSLSRRPFEASAIISPRDEPLPPQPLWRAPWAAAQREVSDVRQKSQRRLLPGAKTTERSQRERRKDDVFPFWKTPGSSDATCEEPKFSRGVRGSAGRWARRGQRRGPAAVGDSCGHTVSCPGGTPRAGDTATSGAGWGAGPHAGTPQSSAPVLAPAPRRSRRPLLL